jgi:hypothetical protein
MKSATVINGFYVCDSTSFEMHFFAKGFTEVAGDDNSAESADEPAAATAPADSEPTSSMNSDGIAHTPTEGVTCMAVKDTLFGKSACKATCTATSVKTPDRTVHAVVKGAEPGYVATPAIFVAVATCLLRERDMVPSGVLTPAAAFFDSPTIYQLLEHCGLTFEVVEDISESK